MINKIYKRIHNKYSTLFNFIFFLRYLFGILFISSFLFLSIPHFFDFKKKDAIIKKYLFESYGLTLINYKDIKYYPLPKPHLEIKNVKMDVERETFKIHTASLNIYPKLFNIYNYENFETNKIILTKNRILLSESELKNLFDYILNLKKKLIFKNLDIKVTRNNLSLINFKKINFSNFGHNRNIVKGKLFDKKFKISINNNFNNINFVLINTGVKANINFKEIKENSKIKGVFKSKLLNSNVKLDFDYDGKKLKIYNSYFRNRNLSFNNVSTITLKPFFSTISTFQVEEININLLKDININKILNSKNLIKKINSKNKINFRSKQFNNNLIDDLNMEIDLAYGRLVFFKKISISENFFKCQGEINLLEEYPILYFDCLISSKDKKKLLNQFSVKSKNNNELFSLNVKGNINILNNKINFENIFTNQNYVASKDDLIYFKQTFENILFDQDFLGIFNYKKIKGFLIEIS